MFISKSRGPEFVLRQVLKRTLSTFDQDIDSTAHSRDLAVVKGTRKYGEICRIEEKKKRPTRFNKRICN